MALRCASASSAAEKRFLASPSRASVSVSAVRSLTIRALPRTLLVLLGVRARGRITNEFSATPRRRAREARRRRVGQVVHRDQQTELAGDAHYGRSLMAALAAASHTLLRALPESRGSPGSDGTMRVCIIPPPWGRERNCPRSTGRWQRWLRHCCLRSLRLFASSSSWA